MFDLINDAKNLGSYSLANAAFVVLADKALDNEKEYFFIWKEAGNYEDIYYDLLVISDGLRESCIPAPLLKNPLAFRSICRKERKKQNHDRIDYLIKKKRFNPDLLDQNKLKVELDNLAQKIVTACPDVQFLCQKYLAEKDCQTCHYQITGHNKGAIHCAVHPSGYPSLNCSDWELNLGLDEALYFQKNLAWEAERREEARKQRVEDNLEKLKQAQEELPKIEECLINIQKKIKTLEEFDSKFKLSKKSLKELPLWVHLFQGYGDSQPSNESPGASGERIIGNIGCRPIWGQIVISNWVGLDVYVRLLHKIPELNNESNGFFHFICVPLLKVSQYDEFYKELTSGKYDHESGIQLILEKLPTFGKKEIQEAIDKRLQRNKELYKQRDSRCKNEIQKLQEIINLL